MARSNKNFDNKKEEILARVWDIILSHGYEQTTLSVIAEELQISKGAFYHYFSTKEDCVNAAIDHYVKNLVNELKELDDKTLGAEERINKMIIYSIQKSHQDNQRDVLINHPENAVCHQKLMISLTKQLAPVYAEIITDGVNQKVFQTNYPLEAAEMMLTIANFYMDKDLFGWEPESMPDKLNAYEEFLVKYLGTGKKINL